MCAKSRSVSGLFKIFSSLKRFRADIGGQFRINTVSFSRRTIPRLSICAETDMVATDLLVRRVLGSFCFAQCAEGRVSILLRRTKLKVYFSG